MILSYIIIYHILLCIIYLYIRRTSNVACWLQTKRTLGMIDRRRDWRSPQWEPSPLYDTQDILQHVAQLENKLSCFATHRTSYIKFFALYFVPRSGKFPFLLFASTIATTFVLSILSTFIIYDRFYFLHMQNLNIFMLDHVQI